MGSQLVASDINDDGKILNKFDKEKFHNHFSMEIFSEKMYITFYTRVYYNQEYHTSESEVKTLMFIDQIIDEYFRPYSHGCFHFSII